MLGMHSPTHDPPHPDGGLPPALAVSSPPEENPPSFGKQLDQLEAALDMSPFETVEELARYCKLFQPQRASSRRHHQPGCRWKPKDRQWVCTATCVQPKASLAVQVRGRASSALSDRLAAATVVDVERALIGLDTPVMSDGDPNENTQSKDPS